MDTAIAGTPNVEAVNAAPTVPEWSTAWPVFGPRLMPDSTMSGALPERAPSPRRGR